jgi:UDP-N-acetyl-D-glucosamine dehydrogenase
MTTVARDGPAVEVPGEDRVPIPRPRNELRLLEEPAVSTIAVVGLGYVGLPTALSLLESGCRVVGVDVSTVRLEAISGLAVDVLPTDRVRLERQLAGDAFELTDDVARLADADTVIVCVPTPVTPQQVPDLRALSAACASVVEHARAGQTVILTSTTYVGCTRDLLEGPLRRRGLRPGRDVHVAFSPERIDPGVPDHVPALTPRVVGGRTADCTATAAAVLRRTCPLVHEVSSPEAAEMTKLLENTFRAVNIALANEFAEIAGHFRLSVTEIIDAAATKPYGFMRFSPGPGVGGHCIPCDPHYLLWQLKGDRITAPLIDAAMTDIALRPHRVVERLRTLLADRGHGLRGASVHVVGVAYKPAVADVRESPALEILDSCVAEGARVSYTDPHVPEVTLRSGEVLRSVVPDEVGADAVLVHTVHPHEDVGWLVHHPLVLDATYRLQGVPHAASV